MFSVELFGESVLYVNCCLKFVQRIKIALFPENRLEISCERPCN